MPLSLKPMLMMHVFRLLCFGLGLNLEIICSRVDSVVGRVFSMNRFGLRALRVGPRSQLAACVVQPKIVELQDR